MLAHSFATANLGEFIWTVYSFTGCLQVISGTIQAARIARIARAAPALQRRDRSLHLGKGRWHYLQCSFW
jgi:hypothetical protein